LTAGRPGVRVAAVAATAFAFTVTMLGTTLPTPLYPLYAQRLDFAALTVSVLFAVYALGVVAALACFGRLSDDVGRRPVLMLATAVAALSAVLFLLPLSVPLLIVARVVSGLSAGLMTGSGTAAVVDLFPAERSAAGGALAIGANMGGLGAGTLLAGVLAQLAPHPLVLPYVVHLVLSVIGLSGLWLLTPKPPPKPPGQPASRPRWRIRPQRLRVPPALRGSFTIAVLSGGAAFAVTGVLTAITALFLAKSLHLTSHALAGGVVCLVFVALAVGQLLARLISSPLLAMRIGCVGLVVAAGCLAGALGPTLLAPLLVAAVVLGASGGLCLNAGIAITVGRTEQASRGSVSSALFAGLYLMLAFPAVAVGVLTDATSLRTAGLIFTAAVAVLAAAVALATMRNRAT